jgi:hypothetical protein
MTTITATLPKPTLTPWQYFSVTIATMLLVACTQVQAQIPTSPATVTLTDTEIAGLVWMLEEEKLAHDVYVSLYDLWGVRTFDNISRSETQHVTAVQSLLERYNIAAASLGSVGVFNDPTLQTLYDDLIARGQTSLEEALRVGAFIEEIDIKDLNMRSAQTDNVDILTVYDNLNQGSRNHLRAFVNQLNRYGINYEPQILDNLSYQAILSSSSKRGTQN